MTPQSNVFHGDCMDFMRQFPDGYFDLGCVDVPYGIGVNNSMGRRKGEKKSNYKRIEWDDCAPDESYFIELQRVCKNQIIWGANHFISKMPYDSAAWIVWDKKFSFDLSFAQCELAWSSFNGVCKKLELVPDRANSFHPTQKPVALYEWLLRNYAKPGDKILDTHMGSQSSRIAAYKLGFDYWGSELDADYFRDGCARFEKEIAMPLFDAIQQPKQEKLFL